MQKNNNNELKDISFKYLLEKNEHVFNKQKKILFHSFTKCNNCFFFLEIF